MRPWEKEKNSLGCTVPPTPTGGCPQRNKSTKCSAMPWDMPGRGERWELSCTMAARFMKGSITRLPRMKSSVRIPRMGLGSSGQNLSTVAAGPLKSSNCECPVTITLESKACHSVRLYTSETLTYCHSSQIEIHFRAVWGICEAYNRFSEYYKKKKLPLTLNDY